MKINLNKPYAEDELLEAISLTEARYGSAVLLGIKSALAKLQSNKTIEVKEEKVLLYCGCRVEILPTIRYLSSSDNLYVLPESEAVGFVKAMEYITCTEE